ncbi:MAG: hypothetical protein P3W95_010110 [Tepidimonas taiwanensis]|nr:hypothetical protein [Tepidimonas taiwanensis]
MAELINAGKKEEADRLLQGESAFIRAGRAVVDTLQKLKLAVQGAVKSAAIQAQRAAAPAARLAAPASATKASPHASHPTAKAAAPGTPNAAATPAAAPATTAEDDWETF